MKCQLNSQKHKTRQDQKTGSCNPGQRMKTGKRRTVQTSIQTNTRQRTASDLTQRWSREEAVIHSSGTEDQRSGGKEIKP